MSSKIKLNIIKKTEPDNIDVCTKCNLKLNTLKSTNHIIKKCPKCGFSTYTIIKGA